METDPPEEKLLRAIFGERGERCHREVNGIGLKQAIEAVLCTLSPRQIEVIQMWFGFNDPFGKERTLKEIGTVYGLSRGRIQQIAAKSLRLLRHPSCSRQLRPYLAK